MGRSVDLSALDPNVMSILAKEVYNAMKYGIENDMIFGTLRDNGVEQDIYEISTTQNYELGTGLRTPDGRLYRYSKSSGACWTGRGAKFMVKMSDGIDFQLLNASQAIGDSEITFATGTHNAFAADYLKGGLVLISDQDSGDTQDKMVQNRMCTGNDASLSNAVCKVYLDRPLTRAVTASTYAFVMPSPYAKIAYDTAYYNSVGGVPPTYISAANYYFWLQRVGPVWLASQGNVGKVDNQRAVVWRHDGSLDLHLYGTALITAQQHAGYIIDNNYGANGGTFFQLQLE